MIIIKNILSIIFLLQIIGVSAHAQIGGPIISREAHKVVHKNPTKLSSEIKSLAKEITFRSHTEQDKAIAIFRWIATNISYDHELRNNFQLQKEIYTSEENVMKNALKRKKALCGGYAFLFRELCKEAGIRSEVVHGFSKKYTSNSSKKNNPDHSWNVVKLDNHWYLLDLTLARSHGSSQNPDMYWFKTNPEYFINTHYPKEIKWTLLANPMTKTEFYRLP
ncbi:transglutaminase domain-containing protein [Ulvibacter antarcticus]|uniref:Transglutaminase superfamily protein n=1 Tax=Ulvibacter antarcticus TaxID=442714 RepID=A0A3L9Z0B6_9FLAO|nr:transglutaminase domain-containing protein [Ulvibacter antarcticus]RMA66306.1 transglutaminase superfamily protein [Ulvibacter antarcticus]